MIIGVIKIYIIDNKILGISGFVKNTYIKITKVENSHDVIEILNLESMCVK